MGKDMVTMHIMGNRQAVKMEEDTVRVRNKGIIRGDMVTTAHSLRCRMEDRGDIMDSLHHHNHHNLIIGDIENMAMDNNHDITIREDMDSNKEGAIRGFNEAEMTKREPAHFWTLDD